MSAGVKLPAAKWPYTTGRWRRLRAVKLFHDPICFACDLRGRVVAADTVDHVKPINQGGEPFPALDGLMSLCASCHSHKTQLADRGWRETFGRRFGGCDEEGNPVDPNDAWHSGELISALWRAAIPRDVKPSGIPVILVCGPPASGKTTWAAARAEADDLVIDLDDCLEQVGGARWDYSDRQIVRRAYEVRDRAICSLAQKRRGKAFLIVGAPTANERRTWVKALGSVEVVVLDVPAEECRRRLISDPKRAAQAERQCRAVERWWFSYTGEGGSQDEKDFQTKPSPPNSIDLFSWGGKAWD